MTEGVVVEREKRMESGTGARVFTAAILIPIVIAAIWFGPTWLIAGMAAFVAVTAMLEFFAMAERLGFQAYRVWTCLAAFGIVAHQWFAARSASISRLGDLLYNRGGPKFTLELVLSAFVLGIAVIVIGGTRPFAEILPSISVSAAGLIFIVLPFSAVVRLQGVDALGRDLLLFAVVLVWVGDSAAYFIGRSIGRWKMSPNVSPNKTWEGAIANFLAALLVGALFGRWSNIQPVHLLVMAGIGNVAGQLGDLFESSWKRSAGVKDSGSILPGHGGMLDRIDALTLAAPAIWYYFEWVVTKR
jgi:phosphatidate cytidylyltransferase